MAGEASEVRGYFALTAASPVERTIGTSGEPPIGARRSLPSRKWRRQQGRRACESGACLTPPRHIASCTACADLSACCLAGAVAGAAAASRRWGRSLGRSSGSLVGVARRCLFGRVDRTSHARCAREPLHARARGAVWFGRCRPQPVPLRPPGGAQPLVDRGVRPAGGGLSAQ